MRENEHWDNLEHFFVASSNSIDEVKAAMRKKLSGDIELGRRLTAIENWQEHVYGMAGSDDDYIGDTRIYPGCLDNKSFNVSLEKDDDGLYLQFVDCDGAHDWGEDGCTGIYTTARFDNVEAILYALQFGPKFSKDMVVSANVLVDGENTYVKAWIKQVDQYMAEDGRPYYTYVVNAQVKEWKGVNDPGRMEMISEVAESDIKKYSL